LDNSETYRGYDEYALKLAGWIISEKSIYDDFITWAISCSRAYSITDQLLIYGYMNSYNIRADTVLTEDEWNSMNEAVMDYDKPFVVLRENGDNMEYLMAYDSSCTTAAGKKPKLFIGEDMGYKVDALLLTAPIEIEYSEKITGTCASYSAKDERIYLRNGCETFSDVFAFAINEYLMCDIHLIMKDEELLKKKGIVLPKDMGFSRTEFMYDAYAMALALCDLFEVDVKLKRKKEVPLPKKWADMNSVEAKNRLALILAAAGRTKERYLKGAEQLKDVIDYFRSKQDEFGA